MAAGYKLRKHIRKVLKTHLAAIWTALTQYNTAAKALSHCTLEFDKVIEYAFWLTSIFSGTQDRTYQHVHGCHQLLDLQ